MPACLPGSTVWSHTIPTSIACLLQAIFSSFKLIPLTFLEMRSRVVYGCEWHQKRRSYSSSSSAAAGSGYCTILLAKTLLTPRFLEYYRKLQRKKFYNAEMLAKTGGLFIFHSFFGGSTSFSSRVGKKISRNFLLFFHFFLEKLSHDSKWHEISRSRSIIRSVSWTHPVDNSSPVRSFTQTESLIWG